MIFERFFVWLYGGWDWLMAFLRLDPLSVCAWAEKGYDYHDYHDSEHGQPDHFVPLTCKRCGKDFWI